jgi:YD repeat-containing protein
MGIPLDEERKTDLGFDARGDVLVRKDGAHASAEPTYDAEGRLGEAEARACRNDAR